VKAKPVDKKAIQLQKQQQINEQAIKARQEALKLKVF